MSKYLCIPSPDGLRLEEVNPYDESQNLYINAITPLWENFEQSKRSFLTDDPRVVVGQQYPADEYELIEQRSYNGEFWKDGKPNSPIQTKLGCVTRQILRRKAEGEKDLKFDRLDSKTVQISQEGEPNTITLHLWNKDDVKRLQEIARQITEEQLSNVKR